MCIRDSVNPVHRIAAMAHAVGAQILVDGAQWVPHARVEMHGAEPGDSLDYLVLSGHKLYAPGSRGALIGSLETLSGRRCVTDVGGGMVEYVSTEDFQVKDEITAREEAGTPNIPGTLSLGMVACLLEQVGMDAVASAEEALTAYAMDRLRSVPGLHLFGPEDPAARVGVFSFALAGVPYGLVAAYLDDYHNIAVRDGCFCAHPYVKELLKVGPGEERDYLTSLAAGDRRTVPGMVRASLGIYSTRDDMDALTAALTELARDRDRAGQQQPGEHRDRLRVARGDPGQGRQDLVARRWGGRPQPLRQVPHIGDHGQRRLRRAPVPPAVPGQAQGRPLRVVHTKTRRHAHRRLLPHRVDMDDTVRTDVLVFVPPGTSPPGRRSRCGRG